MTELSIEKINKLNNKEEIINESITKAKKLQNKLNAFVTIIDTAQLNKQNNILNNVPYACKDNISTKGILTTASSMTLRDYIPIFDATIIEKLNQAGAVNIGKTVLDELGMGGTGLNGHTGEVHNPWHTEHIAGGSSAGSAAAVAAGIVAFALGSDTGDSIRRPASYCGVVGYKPTYGLISRYGLLPFASSLDHLGVITRNVKDAALVVDTVKGIDPKDMTTFDSNDLDLVTNIENKLINKKLFYIKELCDLEFYKNPSDELKKVLDSFHQTIETIKSLGVSINEESLDINLLNAIKPAYDCISCAEATSNNSNLTGIIFGPREEGKSTSEMMINYRTNNFSPLVKRRFIIGSYILQKENQEKYFLNSCRVRTMVINKMDDLFNNYDALIMPSTSSTAPKIKEVNDEIKSNINPLENHMIIANFGGYPSISLPTDFIDNLPVGINLTGKIMDDANVLNIAYQIESIFTYKDQFVKEVK